MQYMPGFTVQCINRNAKPAATGSVCRFHHALGSDRPLPLLAATSSATFPRRSPRASACAPAPSPPPAAPPPPALNKYVTEYFVDLVLAFPQPLG